ncbi:hypothetical protein [Lysinibacillus fusiformis]|uniref:hypothetical protein n=1 Tax=Lysinibacillus fusiformis TaxID=28031 RepID=UPI000883AC2C|nr:hypothetical protein [Lysinibacillus fusiformis]SCX38275.1 hypothetical protein SAMN02787108_00257 [Lysinibacillus fusiformis]SDB05782.1 hypothetical protein SAMN02787070_00308 [Lysinibacillus fusiformis]SFH75883.1 hypothetical protein SAMN02787080_00307 [Lysinibacillus fusiformis]SFT29855.1 hypothetical protein SAMN02787099_04590 [Lysinibacillus fusiformis]
MKKIVFSTFTLILCMGLLFGCGKDNDEEDMDLSEETRKKEHKDDPQKSYF